MAIEANWECCKAQEQKETELSTQCMYISSFPGEAIIVSIPETSLHNGPPDP